MVDREKVINEIEEEIRLGEYWDEIFRIVSLQLLNDILVLLKEQSEIVLCKDCKYGEHMCKPWSDIICNQNRATHIPDWFCADGERKGE